MRRFAVSALLLLPLLAPRPAAAQQTEFEERLDVTEVLLDVLVTDKKGNVILGLQPEDFVVEEDGQRIEVRSATFYSNRRFVESTDAARRLGISADDVPVDRFFILFFHDARRNDPSLIGQQIEAVRRAEHWVDTELLPNDWVAVVRYDASLMIHQDFTTDDEEIFAALKDVAKGKNPSANWPSRMEDHVGPSLRKNLPQGKDLNRRSRRIYDALETLADAADYITGRKNLLFFSMGFGELNDFGTYIPDERFYGDMMEALNDSNTAVYSISLYDALSEQDPAVGTLENGMSLLASDTGGRYFFNFANFATPLRQVVEENNGYYLLSYAASTPAGETGYRKVKVSTANPNFVVKGREGYAFGKG